MAVSDPRDFDDAYDRLFEKHINKEKLMAKSAKVKKLESRIKKLNKESKKLSKGELKSNRAEVRKLTKEALKLDRETKTKRFQQQIKKLDKVGLIQSLKTNLKHFNFGFKKATGLEKGVSSKEWGKMRTSQSILNKPQAEFFARRNGARAVYRATKSKTLAYEHWKGNKIVNIARDKDGKFASKVTQRKKQ